MIGILLIRLIKVWSTNNGCLIKTLAFHFDVITDVAIDKSGKFIAASSKDKIVSIWSISTLELCASLHNHSDEINKLMFTEFILNGFLQDLLFSAGNDGYVNIYSLKAINDSSKNGNKNQCTPIDSIFYKGSQGALYKAISMSAHLTRSIVAIGYEGGIINVCEISKIKDIITHSLLSTVTGHKKDCLLLEWAPNDMLFSGSIDGKAKIWALNDHDELSILKELSIKHTTNASTKCGCICWTNTYKYALACFSGLIKDTEINEIRSFLVTFDINTDDVSIFGDKFEMVGKSYTLCPYPDDDDIVIMGGGYGQLYMLNIKQKVVIRKFWETGAYSCDPFREIDIFDCLFVPFTHDFIAVTSVGTICYYGIRSSEPFDSIPVQQFRKCDYPTLFANSTDALCNVFLIPYEYPPSKSVLNNDRTIENYEVCLRIRKEKCNKENQTYAFMEEDALSYLKIVLAKPKEKVNVENEIEAMAARQLGRSADVNRNIENYNANRNNYLQELRRYRMQCMEEETKSGEESPSGSEYSVELSPQSNDRRNKRRAVASRVNAKYSANDIPITKPCQCSLCHKVSMSEIVQLSCHTNNSKYLVHKSCIELHDLIVCNKSNIYINVDQAIAEVAVNQDKCSCCKLSYPTMSCTNCHVRLHSFECSDMCGGLLNKKYVCIICTNEINRKLLSSADINKKEYDQFKEQLSREWIEIPDIYIPQIGETVYYFHTGHMIFMSSYSLYFAFGKELVRPWKTYRELKKPTLCEVKKVRYTFPTIESYFLLKTYGQLDEASIIIEITLLFESHKIFAIYLFPNNKPDFIVSREKYDQALDNIHKNSICKGGIGHIKLGDQYNEAKIVNIDMSRDWEAVDVFYYKSTLNTIDKVNLWEIRIHPTDSPKKSKLLSSEIVSNVCHMLEQNECDLPIPDTNDLKTHAFIPSLKVINSRLVYNYYKTLEQFNADLELLAEYCTLKMGKYLNVVKIVTSIENSISITPKRKSRLIRS